jgi:hypothetical protein
MKWSKARRRVRVYVTDGYAKYKAFVPRRRPPTSEDYDRIAARHIALAASAARMKPDASGGRVRLRRIFQAPCSLK